MKNKITRWLLSIAALLLVASAATSIAVTSVFNRYNRTDEGAIPISPESWTEAPAEIPEEKEEGPSEEETPAESEEEASAPSGGASAGNASSGSGHSGVEKIREGFRVSDDEKTWETKTRVEIFKVSYENGEGEVTAESFNGQKIVAPGTENSYIFKLKNTGDTPIQYTLNVDAYITPEDTMIPIESRISRHDGEWLVGGAESWVPVPELDLAEDVAILGAGRYTYYTLDWQWPFEGDDELDTYLGNSAMEEDISITIEITTLAVSCSDGESGGDEGLIPPNTGDESILSLWISLAVGASVLLIIIVIFRIREEKRSKREDT